MACGDLAHTLASIGLWFKSTDLVNLLHTLEVEFEYEQIREPTDPGFTDGSETSRTLFLSLGFIWVHSEHVFVDLDLTTSYYDCARTERLFLQRRGHLLPTYSGDCTVLSML